MYQIEKIKHYKFQTMHIQPVILVNISALFSSRSINLFRDEKKKTEMKPVHPNNVQNKVKFLSSRKHLNLLYYLNWTLLTSTILHFLTMPFLYRISATSRSICFYHIWPYNADECDKMFVYTNLHAKKNCYKCKAMSLFPCANLTSIFFLLQVCLSTQCAYKWRTYQRQHMIIIFWRSNNIN